MKYELFQLNSYGEGLPQLKEFLTASAGDNRHKMMSIKKALKNAIVNELTEGQRRVLCMHYYENMGVNEIAKELGINKSSVSRRLQRARVKLGKVLKYGYFPDVDEDGEYLS